MGKNHPDRIAQRNYRLTKWQDRINRFADSDKVKSVKEEIGVLRLLLEERINACDTENDLLIHAGSIAELVARIEHTVVSAHRLDTQLGFMLDKQAVINYAARVVDTITSTVNHFTELGLIDEGVATKLLVHLADKLAILTDDNDPEAKQEYLELDNALSDPTGNTQDIDFKIIEDLADGDDE